METVVSDERWSGTIPYLFFLPLGAIKRDAIREYRYKYGPGVALSNIGAGVYNCCSLDSQRAPLPTNRSTAGLYTRQLPAGTPRGTVASIAVRKETRVSVCLKMEGNYSRREEGSFQSVGVERNETFIRVLHRRKPVAYFTEGRDRWSIGREANRK